MSSLVSVAYRAASSSQPKHPAPVLANRRQHVAQRGHVPAVALAARQDRGQSRRSADSPSHATPTAALRRVARAAAVPGHGPLRPARLAAHARPARLQHPPANADSWWRGLPLLARLHVPRRYLPGAHARPQRAGAAVALADACQPCLTLAMQVMAPEPSMGSAGRTAAHGGTRLKSSRLSTSGMGLAVSNAIPAAADDDGLEPPRQTSLLSGDRPAGCVPRRLALARWRSVTLSLLARQRVVAAAARAQHAGAHAAAAPAQAVQPCARPARAGLQLKVTHGCVLRTAPVPPPPFAAPPLWRPNGSGSPGSAPHSGAPSFVFSCKRVGRSSSARRHPMVLNQFFLRAMCAASCVRVVIGHGATRALLAFTGSPQVLLQPAPIGRSNI